jgi:general secretion pathway protein C
MHLLPFNQSPATMQTALVILVTAGAIALFASIAAHWTWRWLAPAPASSAPRAIHAGRLQPSANALFGNPDTGMESTAPTGSTIRLLGLVASTSGKRGYAVLRVDPKQILTIREGDEVSPGIRLAEVGIEHVILERGAVKEMLGWPARGALIEAPALRLGK